MRVSNSLRRPLAYSLGRCTSAAAVIAALTLANSERTFAQATITWQGDSAAGTPGDGFLWTNPLNWDSDALPQLTDDLKFGNGTVRTIFLNGNQTGNSLTFNKSFSLGVFGSSNTLNVTSGAITVSPNEVATINSVLSSVLGLTLTGGGTLFLTNPNNNLFTSTVTIDGAGTTLMTNLGGMSPQVNGTAAVQGVGRQNGPTLGLSTAARTVNLQNGGEFKLIGAGANPDGATVQFNLGGEKGAINIASTFQQMVLDDVNQIGGFGDLVKNGKGRLSLASQDYNLAGNVIINGGILDLNRIVGGDTTTTPPTLPRFSSLTGVTNGGTNTLTVNSGGALMLNSTTVAALDVPTIILNNGGILAPQGGGHEVGLRTQGASTPASTVQINGTVKVLHRDLFGVQTGRNFFINSDLTGSGILEIHPSTQAASASRLVLQRAIASTFDGTFRLTENANLEANPRYNPVANTGKLLAGGDIEFAGWGSTLDVRDALATTSVFDYTNNEISVTTTQPGALNFIQPTGGTTATTGHLFNFGTLTMGNHRLAMNITTAAPLTNSSRTGFADTASIRGDAVIEMRTSTTAGSFSTLIFSNAVAMLEDAAGRSITFLKTGNGNSLASDVISGGVMKISNVNVPTGTLHLRGDSGAIGTGATGGPVTITVNGGDLAAGARGLPTFGVLNLDSNGSNQTVAAGNNLNRIDDSAIVNLRSNSVLRLTSRSNLQTTETVGVLNVSGHGLIDIVKTGTAPAPVGFTFNTLNLTGTNPTVNFAGASIGISGTNTSRVVIGNQADAAFMGAQYHVGNEWAKYSTATDNGAALGVTGFTAADYVIDPAETTLAVGQHVKLSTVAGLSLSANRAVDTLNLQFTTANQAVSTSGFILSLDKGGILTGVNATGIVGNAGVGGLTAGSTAPSALYVHANSQLDIKLPIVNNAGPDGIFGNADDQAINFVKSGTGTVRLTHQLLGVGVANQGGSLAPFTDPTWTSTFTGSWVINDGSLQVHRGQFLGGRPIVLNGGILEINEPVSIANANTILTGWGNNVTVNGNAMIGSDDNGESADAGVGGNTLVKFGSLTVNNGAIVGMGSFNNLDVAFMGGATFNGKGTINIGVNRSGANGVKIISGAVTGSGFDVVALSATPETLILGGTSTDNVPNTYTGPLTMYGGTVRLNKANGVNAVTDGAAAEDIVINNATLAWGAGHHGDLTTTNNPNSTNNGLNGLAPTSPLGALAAGQNQIPDTATVTLLLGNVGENDRYNNDKWGTLNQRNGTLNVGLGRMEVTTANVFGGGFNMNPGGTFAAGTLNLNVGSYSPTVTTGLPGDPTRASTLEIGAGGLNMTGQNIVVGGGSNGAIAGAGAVLKLGGDVSVIDDPLLGNGGNAGIFIQIGNSFRELGNSKTDLAGGNRTFNIDEDVQFYVTTPLTNGGLVKTGGGALILQPHQSSDFTGAVVVNGGVVAARSENAFGTSAGGVTINSGGTVRLESSWTYGDNFAINGPGALVPGTTTVRELGALVSEAGRNTITGTVTLSGDSSVASNGTINPSATPAGAAYQFLKSDLRLANAGGITGTGTLTLTGNGDGVAVGGLKTSTGGLNKEGAGRWLIPGGGTYTGATLVSAGYLRIANDTALGAIAAGTTVYGGATLELQGGISIAEPLAINSTGADSQSGALSNVSGNNTSTGAIVLGTDSTISSLDGTFTISGGIASAPAPNANRTLTLGGNSNGVISGAIATGSGGLMKIGAGTWSLAGANTFTGGTALTGGVLRLDYTANNSAKISATGALTLAGGSLAVQGNSGADTTQVVNGLSLGTGGGTVTVTNGTGRSATLALGDITRPLDPFTNLPVAGATVSLILPQTGAITTTATLTNGIIGAHATVGENWATKSGNSIAGLATYAVFDPSGTTGTSSNSQLSTSAAITGFVTTNTLKLNGGLTLNLDANTLTLSGGGLSYNGTGGTAVVRSNGGVVSGATGDAELIIHTTGGVLDLGAGVVGFGTGSLTKTGPGTLFLRNNANSSYSGSVNINGGTLVINGTSGTHPTAFGAQNGNRNINVNGATLRILGGYDLNISSGQMQLAIGGSGATIDLPYGGTPDNNGTLIVNDAGQLSGKGDILFTGGSRYQLGQASTGYFDYYGNITVNKGVLNLIHPAAVGGRAEQVITLKTGSTLLNQAVSNSGFPGLPNNIVMETGTSLFVAGGNRAFLGDIQFQGTHTLALIERDNVGQQRDMHLMGKLSGSNVTLNVIGGSNANPLYISNSSNDFTGAINIGNNGALEIRQPGSLGTTNGGVTVNLSGMNSRLLLRHWQNADYYANVVVSNNAEINSDRLVNFGGGSGQLLSINNLTVTGGNLLQFGGGNSYVTQVSGTASFSASPVINVTGNVLFESGMQYSGAGTTLDKRGAGSIILRGPATQVGTTLIQGGVVNLRGANGSLPNTSRIELRGGELRIENSESINLVRLNSAAELVFGGGTLRINGDQTLPGKASAVSGNTVIVYNPASETVAGAISLGSAASPFTRALGATLQFQAAENGGAAVGAATLGNVRVSPRILLPGLPDVGGNSVIPGLLGNNGLDFVQYDGTTDDAGQKLGIRELRNPTPVNSPTYAGNPGEATWTDAVISRTTTAQTLTANRALEALKVEAAITIDTAGFNLRVENGGILAVGNAVTIGGTTGSVTAGPATPGTNTAELFLGGNNTLTMSTNVVNNGAQKVALVKTGTGTVVLSSPSSTYTGGTYINAGQVNVSAGSGLGPSANPIYLAGGNLNLTVGDAGADVLLANFGQPINVIANSQIILDNGPLTGTDNNYAMGKLTIDGPYTLTVSGFDSQDISFNDATLSNGASIDLAQISGRNTGSIMSLGGNLSGNGFNVLSTGNTASVATFLEIGNSTATLPDTVGNTYTGKLVMVNTFPGQQNQPTVRLNKASGTTAITGDVEVSAGTLTWVQDNQVVDTSNILLNFGTVDFAGKNETIGSVTQRGGVFRTNSANVTPANVVTITGDYDATAATNTTAADGLQINSNSTLIINGTLKLNGYSRGVLGANEAYAEVGGVEMTGTVLTQNSGAGQNVFRLSGNVRTFASDIPSNLGNSTDSDTFFELNGTRTFNVADGQVPVDFVLSSVVRDYTGAVPAVGGIIKTGPGMMSVQGGGTANSYTGPTSINEGTLVLFKSAGVNAVGPGLVTVGDGAGGTRADQLVIRSSNQINDVADVVVSASGLLDLNTFNTDEQINSLAGSGAVYLGPNSTLTVSGSLSTSFSGSLKGGGGVTKAGPSTLELNGDVDYYGPTVVTEGALAVKGSIGAVTTSFGSTLSPGIGPALLNVRGNFDLQAGGALKMELGGPIPGTGYDRVVVTGGVTLAGDLQGSLINGFQGSGDYFFLLINDGTDPISGTFNGLPEGGVVNLSGKNFVITYGANFEGAGGPSLTGGNDIALVIPEPATGLTLLVGLGSILGLQRFRRRN